MSKSIKYIAFNGHVIPLIYRHKQWWIPLKPICNALGLDWRAELRAVGKDKILRSVMGLFKVPLLLGSFNKMKCLPEYYIYGWLMQLNPTDKDFIRKQWNCYGILLKHFHPNIKQPANL